MMSVTLIAILFSRHLPSSLGIRVSQVTAAVVAAWTAWESRDGGGLAQPDEARRNWLAKHWAIRIPTFAVFSFMMAFSAVEDGGLALVTMAIGSPGERTLTITGVSSPSRRCGHFDVREVGWLMDRALCAPRADLDRAQAGQRLVVFGKRSAFGLNVERYELRPAS